MWWIIAGGLILIGFFAVCTCCCVIKSDDFNRTAGTDIGADWTEEAGSWEIASGADNFLRTSSSGAVLVLNESVTSTDYAIEINVQSVSDADPVRLYIREDDQNYFAFEVQRFSSVTNSYIRIYEAVAGAETQLAAVRQTTSPGSTFRLRVCVYQGQGVVFGFASSPSGTPPTAPGAFTEANTVTAYSVPVGQEVAIGTGTSIGANVDFDDFFVWQRSESCADCMVCCEADELPTQQVQMEVSGMGGDSCDCSGLDGTYVLDFIGKGVSANATGFNTGGCQYRLDMEEATCGVVRADFWHNTSGVFGNRIYMATLSNLAALNATTGAKAAFFRSATGNGNSTFPEFCPFDQELVLDEFWSGTGSIELCYSTSSGRSGTATITAV